MVAADFPARLKESDNPVQLCQITTMSFAEMKEALVTLSPEQRTELQEHLAALEEGVSVQELRSINSALDEELHNPSPGLSLKAVRANIRPFKPGDS